MKTSKPNFLSILLPFVVGIVLFVLISRMQKLTKIVKKISHEEKPKIDSKEVQDAVVWYMENNPSYVTDVCMPQIQPFLPPPQTHNPEMLMLQFQHQHEQYIQHLNQVNTIVQNHEYTIQMLQTYIMNMQQQQQQQSIEHPNSSSVIEDIVIPTEKEIQKDNKVICNGDLCYVNNPIPSSIEEEEIPLEKKESQVQKESIDEPVEEVSNEVPVEEEIPTELPIEENTIVTEEETNDTIVE